MKYEYVKAIAFLLFVFAGNKSPAEELKTDLTNEDIIKLQSLVDKNILVSNGTNVFLSEELSNARLIEYINSTKSTNCTGTGGDGF